MKRLISLVLLSLSTLVGAATLSPVQLLNPAGSTAGQAIVSTGPSTAPGWAAVSVGSLAPIAANTVLGNFTGASAVPAAFAAPSCSTANSALKYTSGTGLSCGTTFALTSGNLSQFAATTSAQLAGVISDETGSGVLVFGTSPTLTTPNIVGTVSANNAAAGSVGELLANSGSGVSLTTATAKTSVQVTLTPGDWDVSCVNTFTPAGSTTVSLVQTGVSTTDNAFGGAGQHVLLQASLTTGGLQIQASPMVRVNVSASTNAYCIAAANFGTSTMTVDSLIRARRVR